MKRYCVSIIISVIILAGCTNPKNDSNESQVEQKTEDQIRDELYQEVIEVHDVAMLKMETIMNLKSTVISEADSLREVADESLNVRIEALEKTQGNLEEANMAMMVWMRAFRPVADTVTYEDAMKYLESELDKINEVNNKMDQAIENIKSN